MAYENHYEKQVAVYATWNNSNFEMIRKIPKNNIINTGQGVLWNMIFWDLVFYVCESVV